MPDTDIETNDTMKHILLALAALALASCAGDFDTAFNPLDEPGYPGDVTVDRYGETQGRFAPNHWERRMVGLYGR